MGDHGAQPTWMITMSSPGIDADVEVVVSGAVGPAAHVELRDTLRLALLTARSPTPRALTVAMTAVTSTDDFVVRELRELASDCAREYVRLRICVPPALLPQFSELAPFLQVADSTATSTWPLQVVPTWIDQATLVVAVTGELDLVSTPHLRDDLAVILAGQPLRLVLDLTQVSFLASTGANEIVRLAHTATDDAVTMHVAAGVHNRRTFELLGLAGTVLRVFDTRVDALAAFAA
ncbi:STAS domain-containing protein [Amycolatopsis sp. cmx-4-83]|uniref:STAS domain-containing protein n=1 Tax=Amycolatopsis sp. cmx-4-83 TaxID=2790940 RepID=UPI00397D3F54